MKCKDELEMKAVNELLYKIKQLIENGSYENAFQEIDQMMGKFPHNPVPHNLLGILLEKVGEHFLAMKHFRVACVLDPGYEPANENISNFANIHPIKKYAFDESDCRSNHTDEYRVVYDGKHIGHTVKKGSFF